MKDDAICLLADSHANLTVSQGNEKPAKIQGICGESASEHYAEYDPNTHSLRTFQVCLPLSGDDFSTEFLATWPPQGMMRNGKLYPLAPLVPHIHGKECGLLPTIQKVDYKRKYLNMKKMVEYIARGHQLTLVEICLSNGKTLAQTIEIYEMVMGYEIGWTEFHHSETP